MAKKAVSPIIATILLVAFSVALGAIVMNFTESSTNELKDRADKELERGVKCSLDMSVSILEIDDEKYICYNRTGANNLEVIVENQGSATAEDIQIFLLDSNENAYTEYGGLPLGAHNRTKYNISLGSGFVFPPTKVLISPVLSRSDSSIEVCTNNRIDIEEIEQCD